MKTTLLIVISVLLGSLGQVILKLGSNKLGTIEGSWQTIPAEMIRLLKTPEIVIGLGFFGTSFLLWIKVLTRAELSYAYPMMSLGYINVALLSYFLLQETLTPNKVIGTAIVIIGIIVMNK